MTDYTKKPERPEMLCKVCHTVTEATDSGLKLVVGLIQKCSCLVEVQGC